MANLNAKCIHSDSITKQEWRKNPDDPLFGIRFDNWIIWITENLEDEYPDNYSPILNIKVITPLIVINLKTSVSPE